MKYIHTAKLTSEQFEKEILFSTKIEITKSNFYELIFRNYGFSKNGIPRILIIEDITINKIIKE